MQLREKSPKPQIPSPRKTLNPFSSPLLPTLHYSPSSMAPKRSKTAIKTKKHQHQKKIQKRSRSDLKTLGHQLLSSRAHVNNLPILLTYISPTSPPSYIVESLISLQSFFSPIISTLPPSSSLSSSNGAATVASDPEVVYRTWLRSKFDELVKSLIVLAVSPQCEETVRVSFSVFFCVLMKLLQFILNLLIFFLLVFGDSMRICLCFCIEFCNYLSLLTVI